MKSTLINRMIDILFQEGKLREHVVNRLKAVIQVDRAVEAGLILETERSWAEEYAQRNPEGFKSSYGNRMAFIRTKGEVQDEKPSCNWAVYQCPWRDYAEKLKKSHWHSGTSDDFDCAARITALEEEIQHLKRSES